MPKKPIDISGKFGKLTVIHCNLQPRKRVLVKCDCGKEFAVTSYDLTSGRTKSCGSTECSSRSHDLTNQRFGSLIVQSLSKHKNDRGELIWICKCDCGKTRRVKSNNLTKGYVKSCGCQKDILKSKAHTKPIEEVAVHTVWLRYVHNSKIRNISFDLSEDDVKFYMGHNCHYCNSPPNNTLVMKNISGDRYFKYNGIDRIDSNIGYRNNNCLPCCRMCNIAKSNSTLDEFLTWAKALVIHQKLV